MAERLKLDDSWQNDFEKMNLQKSPLSFSSTQSSQQNDFNSRYKLNQHNDDFQKNNTLYQTYDTSVTLEYQTSIGSTASSSSLSRHPTLSSTTTDDSNLVNIRGADNSLSLARTQLSSQPRGIFQIQHYHHLSSPFLNYNDIIEPNGCFVPSKSLPFMHKTDITNKYHYVIPTFAMVGETQAKVMDLLFNYKDNQPFTPKEEYERTIRWNIDCNSSLITLSQYTCLPQDDPVSKNYLVELSQRLGITTILIIISLEAIETIYLLLSNLVKALETDTANSNSCVQQEQHSWWNRVVIIVNQQHGIHDQVAYSQRKNFLMKEMPRIQARYHLPQPLSTLFISTQVYERIKDTNDNARYKSCCQKILWQMTENHILNGSWYNELTTFQIDKSTPLINILNEDDESSTSSDDTIFQTVINYVNGKIKKPEKRKKKLQRRQIQRQLQKLHSCDGDDGTSLPNPL
ncbi:MAG: hypothetical protein EXX96DRAFT_564128 [Benjaminiella poitrasii]|nr:MAG: hypothetical protein EXX96DRAFT_564128 [Benjaminiella poitrasii]